MASAQERTERATPSRRRKARERGQIARSMELTSALTLLVGTVVVWVGSKYLWSVAEDMMRMALLQETPKDLSMGDVGALFRLTLAWTWRLLTPLLLGTALTAIAASLAQVGFLFTFYPLRWEASRVSPIEGLRRLISVQGLVQALKSVLKVTVLLIVAALAIRKNLPQVLAVGTLPLPEMLRVSIRIVWDIAMRCCGTLLVLGLLDYAYQRYVHEKSLMMTHQDIRQETRETEGDPQVQARRRQRRRALLEGGISREMPQASVVVTNPSHVAVALWYQQAMAAPKVVAKGRGLLAQRIIHYARLYDIPVHQDPPLARALFKQAKVGEMIPTALYRAVAEVLAIILRQRERMRRRQQARSR
jgi:flagellar biosynthesis protein FlhB